VKTERRLWSLAHMLRLFAMTMAPLGYVAPVREMSMLLGVLLGALLLYAALVPLQVPCLPA